MNSWKIILAAVVIFGAGAITGGLLVNPGLKQPEILPPRWLAGRHSTNFVQRLNKDLHLTPAQSNNIARVIAEGQERNRELWTNVEPHMRKVMRDVNQQIRAELTPEQLKQFEVLMKQLAPRRPPSTNNAPRPVATTNVPPPAPTNLPPGS
jgi:hypothetical protein